MRQVSDWTPLYPKSVKLRNGYLVDTVVRRKYLVSKSIMPMLEKIDGKTKLKYISKNIHFMAFIEMNKKGLINFKIPLKQQILLYLKYLLSLFSFPVSIVVPSYRYDPPKNSLLRIFFYLFWMVLKNTYLFLALAALPAIMFFSFLRFPIGILIVALLVLSIVLSIVIHEFAHVFVLYKKYKTGLFFILISEFISISIVKISGEPRKEFLTAAAGPLSTAFISWLFIALSLFFNNTFKILILLESLIFALASISIMPFFSDGKIVRAYMTEKNKC